MVTKSPICTLLWCRVATCAGHAAGPSHIHTMARRVTQHYGRAGQPAAAHRCDEQDNVEAG